MSHFFHWTDQDITLNWLKTEFDPSTGEKANGQTQVLILDGHSSHCSLKFLLYAAKKDISILVYPPHCTHALQGLDAVCFAILKRIRNEMISAFELETGRDMKKEDFTKVFGKAYLAAMEKETILLAFKKTGVSPFDRTDITAQQMRPSERTSIKATFPLTTMSSPVKRIVDALGATVPNEVRQLDSEGAQTHQNEPGMRISIQASSPQPNEFATSTLH